MLALVLALVCGRMSVVELWFAENWLRALCHRGHVL